MVGRTNVRFLSSDLGKFNSILDRRSTVLQLSLTFYFGVVWTVIGHGTWRGFIESLEAYVARPLLTLMSVKC